MTALARAEDADQPVLATGAGRVFAVGQEVTVGRRIWEPADDCHPGGMLAQPGDRLIVRAIRGRGEWPVSVSHHDRTDGLTFSVAQSELQHYAEAELIVQAGAAALEEVLR